MNITRRFNALKLFESFDAKPDLATDKRLSLSSCYCSRQSINVENIGEDDIPVVARSVDGYSVEASFDSVEFPSTVVLCSSPVVPDVEIASSDDVDGVCSDVVVSHTGSAAEERILNNNQDIIRSTEKIHLDFYKPVVARAVDGCSVDVSFHSVSSDAITVD